MEAIGAYVDKRYVLFCVCLVVADGQHSYMDLSPQHHYEYVMRPPVSSQRWALTARCHSHTSVSSLLYMLILSTTK